MELAPIFKKAYGLLAFVGFLYILGVFSLTYPSVQRMVLYVNQFNPTYFQDNLKFSRLIFEPRITKPSMHGTSSHPVCSKITKRLSLSMPHQVLLKMSPRLLLSIFSRKTPMRGSF
ncbi:lysophospholipase and esterase/lipase domain protein [Histoplasma capsulatum]|uniref:Lysophospholipase and esterase/lipase domain protein n=1 Tax=Ajellomyces capsulatus TaxID=5037 RepID=A0A8A1MIS6_AJECA|nr:lysophospholipase and esterase/lipase domain protein [Histoplasma capsulatum]